MDHTNRPNEDARPALRRLIEIVTIDLLFMAIPIFDFVIDLYAEVLKTPLPIGTLWPWVAAAYVARAVVAALGVASMHGLPTPKGQTPSYTRFLLAFVLIGAVVSLPVRALLPTIVFGGMHVAYLIAFMIAQSRLPTKWDPVWRDCEPLPAGPASAPSHRRVTGEPVDERERAMQEEIAEVANSGRDPLVVQAEIQEIRDRYTHAESAQSAIA